MNIRTLVQDIWLIYKGNIELFGISVADKTYSMEKEYI